MRVYNPWGEQLQHVYGGGLHALGDTLVHATLCSQLLLADPSPSCLGNVHIRILHVIAIPCGLPRGSRATDVVAMIAYKLAASGAGQTRP